MIYDKTGKTYFKSPDAESKEAQSKKLKKKDKKFFGIIFLAFFAVFLFSGYKLATALLASRKANTAYTDLRLEMQESTVVADPEVVNETHAPGEPVISMDFAQLYEMSENVVGWIRCEGTPIDYPVMQTDNNSYYLYHLYNGEENVSGSIFADYRNSSDLQDPSIVIYGHHMRDTSMFNTLKEYKDPEFYETHPIMMLYTPSGDYRIELLSGTVEDGTYEFVRFSFDDEEDFMNYINDHRALSTFQSDVSVEWGDRIVALCTCSYEKENARYMILGKLVPVVY